MNIADLINAIQQAGPQLNTQPGKNKHEHVERFQAELLKALNAQQKYNWYAETIMSGGKHLDRADLYGSDKAYSNIIINGNNIQRIHTYSSKYNICEKTCDNDWIIEIDAIRADQVAAKFLSRLALVGLSSKTIHYVAVLYSYTQDNEANCIKYCKFATEIMKKINPKSTVDLIIINQQKKTIKHYNLKKSLYNINYNHNKYPLSTFSIGMADAIKKVVGNYINRHSNITFQQLKEVFGNYVAGESGPSRYKPLGIQLKDGSRVYTYSQLRNNYGPQENWSRFVNLCYKLKISIDEDYTFTQYKY